MKWQYMVYVFSHVPSFHNTRKEAIRFLKDAKIEGQVYKVKLVAISHKKEEWIIDLTKNIKVEQPVELKAKVLDDVYDGGVDEFMASDIKEAVFIPIQKCFICGNRAEKEIDGKLICKDCAGA
jgi:hypothetical protein